MTALKFYRVICDGPQCREQTDLVTASTAREAYEQQARPRGWHQKSTWHGPGPKHLCPTCYSAYDMHRYEAWWCVPGCKNRKRHLQAQGAS